MCVDATFKLIGAPANCKFIRSLDAFMGYHLGSNRNLWCISLHIADWRELLQSIRSVNLWSTNGASNKLQGYSQISTADSGLFGTDKTTRVYSASLPQSMLRLTPSPPQYAVI